MVKTGEDVVKVASNERDNRAGNRRSEGASGEDYISLEDKTMQTEGLIENLVGEGKSLDIDIEMVIKETELKRVQARWMVKEGVQKEKDERNEMSKVECDEK